jgi:hypothetical protein
MHTLDSQVAFLRRSHSTAKGQATRRANKAAKVRAECDAVHRRAFVGHACKALGDFVHEHAPATEFTRGSGDTRFTTSEVRDAIAEGDAAVASALLTSAEQAGIIRPVGEDRWEVVAEEPIYDESFTRTVFRSLAA